MKKDIWKAHRAAMRQGKRKPAITIRMNASGKFLIWNAQTVSLNGGNNSDMSAVANSISAYMGLTAS